MNLYFSLDSGVEAFLGLLESLHIRVQTCHRSSSYGSRGLGRRAQNVKCLITTTTNETHNQEPFAICRNRLWSIGLFSDVCFLRFFLSSDVLLLVYVHDQSKPQIVPFFHPLRVFFYGAAFGYGAIVSCFHSARSVISIACCSFSPHGTFQTPHISHILRLIKKKIFFMNCKTIVMRN